MQQPPRAPQGPDQHPPKAKLVLLDRRSSPGDDAAPTWCSTGEKHAETRSPRRALTAVRRTAEGCVAGGRKGASCQPRTPSRTTPGGLSRSNADMGVALGQWGPRDGTSVLRMSSPARGVRHTGRGGEQQQQERQHDGKWREQKPPDT